LKISKLIVLALFLTFTVWTSGCVTTEEYTELSDELSAEETEIVEDVEESIDEEEYIDEEEGVDEELLEERITSEEREIPDILKPDPELIRLAEETGALYTIYFGYDSYSIGLDFLETIKKNAQWIKSNPDVSIILEGHADERGGNEYNLALSQRRAQSIEKFLSDFGVDKRRLTLLSYGEEKPANNEHDEAAWRENRRVEVKILY
jgi:peptidoglycan-associated lipoprotein